MYKTVFFATGLILILGFTSFGQNDVETFSEKRLVIKECKVPYELVVLSVKYQVGHIYILTEDKYIDENKLSILFRCLSKKYQEFTLLKITLYSNREKLNVAIKDHFQPPPHTNPPTNTSEGNCEELSKTKKTSPPGFFRAYYFRIDDREFFDFSEDKNNISLKRVYLQ